MTQEEIIRMAREAGFNHHHNPDLYDCMIASDKAIKRFAVLLLASTDPQSSMSWQEGNEAGRLAEREACKKLAKEHAAEYKVGGRLYTMLGMNTSKPAEAACDHIAHLISERGRA